MTTLEIELNRETIEAGRTFSARAVEEVSHVIARWIAENAIEHWDRTGVPPTRAVLRVELQ